MAARISRNVIVVIEITRRRNLLAEERGCCNRIAMRDIFRPHCNAEFSECPAKVKTNTIAVHKAQHTVLKPSPL